MGNTTMSQSTAVRFFSGTRDDFARFIGDLRELLDVEISLEFESRTAYYKTALEHARTDLEKSQTSENVRFGTDYEQRNVDNAQKMLDDREQEAKRDSEIRATIRGSGGKVVTFSGTSEELFSLPEISTAKSLTIDVAGRLRAKSITVFMHRLYGNFVSIESNDADWFELAMSRAKRAVKRIRPPWAFLFDLWVWPIYMVILSILASNAAGPFSLGSVSLGVVAPLAVVALLYFLRMHVIPGFRITDALGAPFAMAKWAMNVLGAVALAVLGGIVVKVFNI